jgi:hypothetical protein
MANSSARDEASTLETALQRLEAFLGELEPYLLSQEVFWASDAHGAGRDPSRPRMTAGSILLLQDRLSAGESSLTSSQRSRWHKCQHVWEAALLTWRAALERKAASELSVRLRLWRGYLEEAEQGEQDRANFATEVRNRVIADRLVEALLPPGQKELASQELGALDRRLRAAFQSGDFIWPRNLTAVYPRDRFWFLYGGPRERQ